MNRHDLLIKTRSTFPRPSLPPSFVVTAARSHPSAGLVSYACWSCSFVKGRCYNLCDLPLCCLLWQSRDGKKCLEYFWQKKKIYTWSPRKDSGEDVGVLYSWEKKDKSYTSVPPPPKQNHLCTHMGILQISKSLVLKIYCKTAIKVSEQGKKKPFLIPSNKSVTWISCKHNSV